MDVEIKGNSRDLEWRCGRDSLVIGREYEGSLRGDLLIRSDFRMSAGVVDVRGLMDVFGKLLATNGLRRFATRNVKFSNSGFLVGRLLDKPEKGMDRCALLAFAGEGTFDPDDPDGVHVVAGVSGTHLAVIHRIMMDWDIEWDEDEDPAPAAFTPPAPRAAKLKKAA